jgi:branched-chain amino acid aminotransferase
VSLQVWIDGKLLPKDQARISVYDHGLLYGDGVFEGIRVYNGRVFECEAHLERLWASARAIRLTIPISPSEFKSAIQETVKANGFKDCYIRALITRGVGYLGLNPNRCPKPSIIIIADLIELYPQEMYEKGMSIITASVIRNHPNALSPRIKSLNYLNNILAKIEGMQAGCVEALVLNQKGEVSECTGDNIFLVRKGELLTPSVEAGILEGITRSVVLELAREMKIPVRETPLTKHDVYIADECFLTGSAAEIVPVTKVDSRKIGDGLPGPITRRLLDRFHEVTRQ